MFISQLKTAVKSICQTWYEKMQQQKRPSEITSLPCWRFVSSSSRPSIWLVERNGFDGGGVGSGTNNNDVNAQVRFFNLTSRFSGIFFFAAKMCGIK